MPPADSDRAIPLLGRRAFLAWTASGTWALGGCASPAPQPAARSAPASSAAALVAVPGVASGRPPERVRVFHVGQAAHLGPLWVAKDAGYLEKYGLDVEITLLAAPLASSRRWWPARPITP